jgi:proteasome lid subunit RPN8/RPN11
MNEVYKFLLPDDLLSFLKKEGEKNLLTEICGLLSFENGYFFYKPMKNISSENNFFKISPKDYLDFITNHKCFCIFHTHISGNEKPSEIDILNARNCCKAYLIYSVITEKFSLFEPQTKDYDVSIIEPIKLKV